MLSVAGPAAVLFDLYSITSLAVANSVSGMVRSSALAVLRFDDELALRTQKPKPSYRAGAARGLRDSFTTRCETTVTNTPIVSRAAQRLQSIRTLQNADKNTGRINGLLQSLHLVFDSQNPRRSPFHCIRHI